MFSEIVLLNCQAGLELVDFMFKLILQMCCYHALEKVFLFFLVRISLCYHAGLELSIQTRLASKFTEIYLPLSPKHDCPKYFILYLMLR